MSVFSVVSCQSLVKPWFCNVLVEEMSLQVMYIISPFNSSQFYEYDNKQTNKTKTEGGKKEEKKEADSEYLSHYL